MALYDKDTYNKTISVKPKFGMKGANGKEEEVISRGKPPRRIRSRNRIGQSSECKVSTNRGEEFILKGANHLDLQ